MTNYLTRLSLVACCALLSLTGCATSFRPTAPVPSQGLTAFTFQLTPEQCQQLKKERRGYHSTEKASVSVMGAGALVTTLFLAVPALRDEQVVQGASAGVSLLAGSTAAFTNTQVSDLDTELADGGCSR